MVTIYLREGKHEAGEKGRPLIVDAAVRFLMKKEEKLDDSIDESDYVNRFLIEVDQYGKPYFPFLPLEFSLSHCREMWMCAFSDRPCGIDVQERRRVNWDSISSRHFTEGERRFVEQEGEEGFFRIWVRKEALGKLIGRGIFGPMPSVTTDDGKLLDRIELEDGSPGMKEIEISKDVFCALCSYDEEGEEFRLL